MQAVRINTNIADNGNLILEKLPFRPGEAVEVIVLERTQQEYSGELYPLRGISITYLDPFGPISESDWEVLN